MGIDFRLSSEVGCTIASANYFGLAATVATSFVDLHPGRDFVILVVDKRISAVDELANSARFKVVYVEDLGIPNFESVAFKYDIVELNTNTKPSFLKMLLALGAQKVLYFDPDIFIYAQVGFIYEQLNSSNILVTPHATQPVADFRRPSDQDFLATGTFNLGFIGISGSDEGRRFLDWWECRCLENAFADTRVGLFVDQKWVDLAPCYFAGVSQLRHPGCNMGPWNLHERMLRREGGAYTVNSEPLIFYHFSGIDMDSDKQISKNQAKFTLDTRPDLQSLYDEYRKTVEDVGAFRRFRDIKYSFGSFSNGDHITHLARRVYSIRLANFAGMDPFNSDGAVFKYMRRANLLSSTDGSGKMNSLNFNRKDKRIWALNHLFKLALSILGCDRYTMLMKYLSYISILRNQGDIFPGGGD